MKIVNFPLRVPESKHRQMKDAAWAARESLHDYIMKSVEERMKAEQGGGMRVER